MYAVEWLVLFETYGWNYLSVLFNIYADSLACPCVKGYWSWRSISGTFFSCWPHASIQNNTAAVAEYWNCLGFFFC